ncbi:MAG TPA: ATP-binding protein [Micropepsaceae bacterium]|nr:ATP-binding protein [Micropepsaceae bacterium]
MSTLAEDPPKAPAFIAPQAMLDALSHPVIAVDDAGRIIFANQSAEQFFGMSAVSLTRQLLSALVPFASPLTALVGTVKRTGAPVNEYDVELALVRGQTRQVDVQGAPLAGQAGATMVMLLERTMAQKMDRQMTHRGAARSITAMAAVLAHEIKNPLAGIRGAAQLIEQNANAGDKALTRLICDETDRIRKLVDHMESFGDTRPLARKPVNIHEVLDHVHSVARASFAARIRFSEIYDPSLPPVLGDKDQLIQVFLNLVRNAADAIADGPAPTEGEIILQTGYRPGVRLSIPGTDARVGLPLEVIVRDNGAGVPPELMSCLFDPFVTTKRTGAGLGLALVARIVNAHGGVIECESQPRRTLFRVLLPMSPPGEVAP